MDVVLSEAAVVVVVVAVADVFEGMGGALVRGPLTVVDLEGSDQFRIKRNS